MNFAFALFLSLFFLSHLLPIYTIWLYFLKLCVMPSFHFRTWWDANTQMIHEYVCVYTHINIIVTVLKILYYEGRSG